MQTHTKLLLLGGFLFVLPIPGTVILGALVLLAGTGLYWTAN